MTTPTPGWESDFRAPIPPREAAAMLLGASVAAAATIYVTGVWDAHDWPFRITAMAGAYLITLQICTWWPIDRFRGGGVFRGKLLVAAVLLAGLAIGEGLVAVARNIG